jgi:hypothetical protein
MLKKNIPDKGFVLISIDFEEQENMVIMKTNKDLKIVDSLEITLSKKESAEKVAEWIGQPNDYRFASVNYDEFALFSRGLDKYNQNLPKDFVRILKSRYWNAQSEIIYRLKCPSNFSLNQLTLVYGLTTHFHSLKHISNCLQLGMLINAYFFDDKTTVSVIKNGYENVLRERCQKQSTEKLMSIALEKGFDLNLCHTISENGVVIQLDAQKGEEAYSIKSKSLHYIFIELCLKLF